MTCWEKATDASPKLIFLNVYSSTQLRSIKLLLISSHFDQLFSVKEEQSTTPFATSCDFKWIAQSWRTGFGVTHLITTFFHIPGSGEVLSGLKASLPRILLGGYLRSDSTYYISPFCYCMASTWQDHRAPKGCNWSLSKDAMLSGVPAQECAQETNLGNPALCFRKQILCQLVEITLAAQKWERKKDPLRLCSDCDINWPSCFNNILLL